MKIASSIFAGIIGGLVGFVAALIGSGVVMGVLAGAITGAAIGFVFSLSPRSFNDPRIAIESLSPAGLVGGIVASVVCNTGFLWGVIVAIAGWLLGLVVPAIIMAKSK